jgi:hypothetical protein
MFKYTFKDFSFLLHEKTKKSNKISKPWLTKDLENFETQIDEIFGEINEWLKINQLILNHSKTHFLTV